MPDYEAAREVEQQEAAKVAPARTIGAAAAVATKGSTKGSDSNKPEINNQKNLQESCDQSAKGVRQDGPAEANEPATNQKKLEESSAALNAGASEAASKQQQQQQLLAVNSFGQANQLARAQTNADGRLLTGGVSKQKEAQANERKGSVVSFQTTCELYEVDLDTCKPLAKPSCLNSVRYYVMLLALLSPFVTTYSRTIINFAITDMIDPNCSGAKSESTTIATTTTTTTTATTSADGNQPSEEIFANCSLAYFDMDNSCPVDDVDRVRLIEGNKKDIERARTSVGEKFKWDTWYQGLLKSAYAVGHAPFQIPGSRLSERYGSHWVMSISSTIIAVLCLLAPFLAALHFWLLYLDLFMLGVLGSFMTPALITLFSNWLTPGEKTITLSFYLIASRLGYALSSFLCGLLISAQLSWRYVFFSAGVISFIFSALFVLFARSRPQDHPLVGQVELEYLATKNTLVRESLARRHAREAELARAGDKAIRQQQQQQQEFEMKLANNHGTTVVVVGAAAEKQLQQQQLEQEQAEQNKSSSVNKGNKHHAPWLQILTNVPVWAFIITKFCVKLAGDTVQIELPTYLNRVMHYGPKENGKINAWIYVIFCVGCFVVGTMAKSISKSKPFGLSKTAIRKIFQCVASFGVSLAIMGLAFSVCDKASTEYYLMLIFFVTTFGTGGEAQIPLDISERYAGTIHAMGSSLAISSAIEPMLVGFLMRGHAADKESWKTVWLGAGSIASFGGLVFLFFADARIQPFDRIGSELEEKPDDIEKGQIEVKKEKPLSIVDANNNQHHALDENNNNNNNLYQTKTVNNVAKDSPRDSDEPKAQYRESTEI